MIQTNDPANYPPSVAIPVRTSLDLRVNAASDTITVGAWSDTPYSDATCASGSFSCDEQTFAVEADPCASPATPSQPTALTSTNEGSNCNSSRVLSLDWNAPATGPVKPGPAG